jgi:hypothetical protein
LASGIRIYALYTLVNSADFTWAMSLVFIWSCCEPFTGIICACLPALAPLVRKWRGETKARSYGSSGPQGSRSMGAKSPGGKLTDWSIRGHRERLPDDEMELTTNISTVVDREPHISRGGSDTSDIHVQKEFTWSTRRKSLPEEKK